MPHLCKTLNEEKLLNLISCDKALSDAIFFGIVTFTDVNY